MQTSPSPNPSHKKLNMCKIDKIGANVLRRAYISKNWYEQHADYFNSDDIFR